MAVADFFLTLAYTHTCIHTHTQQCNQKPENKNRSKSVKILTTVALTEMLIKFLPPLPSQDDMKQEEAIDEEYDTKMRDRVRRKLKRTVGEREGEEEAEEKVLSRK